MEDISPYKDIRREFFAQYFKQALPYDEYSRREASKAHWPKWERYADKIALTQQQITNIERFKRKINILVLSGVWCGDCQRQGPMLEKISSHTNLINLRFIESREHSALQDELRINGAEKVPVVVFLSEDFLEIQRFGDRHLSVYRRLADENAAAYCETGIGDPETNNLKQEMAEWVDTFERVSHLLYSSPFLKKRYNN